MTLPIEARVIEDTLSFASLFSVGYSIWSCSYLPTGKTAFVRSAILLSQMTIFFPLLLS